MPVADQGEGKQQECNQQQPGSLRRIDCMAMVLVGGVVFVFGCWHGFIVALARSRRTLIPQVVAQFESLMGVIPNRGVVQPREGSPEAALYGRSLAPPEEWLRSG